LADANAGRANETWRATCTVSTQHFSRRFLTIDGFPQIKVQRLRGNPDHVPASQLWGANVSN
jgi:hypothetical protein